MRIRKPFDLTGLLASSLLLLGCTPNETLTGPNSDIQLKKYSVNETLVKALPGFESLAIYPLISSDDTLKESPSFIFGAQPDGAGLLKNPTGEGYILLTNHEILRSVSRVYLDKTFKPIRGEYLVDGEGGMWRLCSATMVTPPEHGFGPLYLTASEGDAEGMVYAIDPLGVADKKNRTRVLPALGKASFENALTLPKGAFPGKTVVILSEDSGDGQLTAYVSNTVGDLQNGKLYCLRRTNEDPVEVSMGQNQTYDVEFVELEGAKTATGAQIAAMTREKKAIQFSRIEDVDYRKGSAANGREVFFAITGVGDPGAVNWGRVYHLKLDEGNPLKGKLSVIADGSVDPGNNIINPDNICATENYVYIQEDGDSAPGAVLHDGRIWQYGINTKQLKPMLEMAHRRGDVAFEKKYNLGLNQRPSSWEYGAMLDISDIIGVPNTFLVNIHAHTWLDPKFINADGSGLNTNQEGGQVVIVQGVLR